MLTLECLPAERRGQLADSFVAAGASQCGYCTPGVVMKGEAFLRRVPNPSDDEIRQALAGNLCRCTGYVKIIDAIRAVALGEDGAPTGTDAADSAIGSPAPRYGGYEQTLGEQQFVGDMSAPGMLHGAVRFSDHPRALVVRIDTSAAQRVPGVMRVATWRDVPGERIQGLLVPDWPLLVAEGEETRYVGDMIGFDIAHPCLTFDKWRTLPVLNPQFDVIDVIKTFF